MAPLLCDRRGSLSFSCPVLNRPTVRLQSGSVFVDAPAANMSRYVTPFLVVNLGAEMVFVVAQRLQAQKIPHETSAFVLDEIISVLVSPQLMTEISKPQSAYSHESVKDLIEDVTQSSAMRLDTKSMDKLWDLITMVFKWQIFHCTDLLKLTARHLYEVENYVMTEETQLQLHKVQNLFDNYTKILSQNEKVELRECVIGWLQDYNVRVSLLLRFGLQDQDGNFVVDDLDPFSEDLLRNLGENIYSVTQNGKLYKSEEKDETKDDRNEGFELDMLADQILGDRKLSTSSDSNVLKLAINRKDDNDNNTQRRVSEHFDNLQIERNRNQLDGLFDDLSLIDSDNQPDLQNDLINMIEGEN